MSHSHIFLSMPTLHREWLPQGMERFQTLWPGLPAPRGGWSSDVWHHPKRLLFTPQQASACLHELGLLDEASLASFSASASFRQSEQNKAQQEKRDLANFAAGAAVKEDAQNDEALLRWAQHYLLLGWLQEERVLEMEQLSERYREGAARLAAQLGNGEGSEEQEEQRELFAAMAELVPEDVRTLLPSWRFMLELSTIVLGPECIFCTADSRMEEAVLKLEQPAVVAALQDQLPADLKVRGGRAPLWRWLGHESAVSTRPWLDAERTILMCYPEAGAD